MRWWYALPIWPPANFDYKKALLNANLQLVEQKRIRSAEAKQNAVYAVEHYEGLYMDVN